MSVRRTRLLITLGLGAATLASVWPLFQPGIHASDEETHWLMRLSQFDHALSEGQWWPRWFPDFEWGHGYPYPNFYAPGGLWLAWVCYQLTLGNSLLWGVKGAFLLAAGLGTFGMYRFLRPTVSRSAAVSGVLLYTLAPYHTLNIFVRGNLAEYLAMGMFPWALWGLRRLRGRHGAKSLFLACVLVAGFQLCHTLSALFGTGVLVGVALLGWLLGGFHHRALVWRVAAIGVGTLLSTVYWLPALWDSQYVRVSMLAEQIVAADHVVYPHQLFDPRWGRGYSLPGPEDGISFHMGYPHVLALILGVLAIVHRHRGWRDVLQWLLICLVLLLVMIPLAASLWTLPLLKMIQFPWRLLAWVAAASAVVGALTLDASGICRRAWAAAIVIVICLTQLWFVRSEFQRQVDEVRYSPPIVRAYYRGNTGEDDYLPRWVLEKPAAPASQTLGVIDEPASVRVLDWGAFDRRWSVETAMPNRLRIDLYRFPNWRVTVDDQPVPVTSTRFGTMVFPVAPGAHEIRVRWVDTPIHLAAKLISTLTLVVLLLLVLRSIREDRRRSATDAD